MPSWTRASFRRLFPWEADLYAAHLKALTTEGRRRRFWGAMSDGALEAHAARAIQTCHVEACFLDGQLIGAFEMSIDELLFGHAEVALSVDPAHHRNGLGSELIARARARACLLGAAEIDLQIQRDNSAMIALARHAGAPLCRTDDGLGAALSVPRPDLRRLPVALAQDWASLLQDLSWSVLRRRRGLFRTAYLTRTVASNTGVRLNRVVMRFIVQ